MTAPNVNDRVERSLSRRPPGPPSTLKKALFAPIPAIVLVLAVETAARGYLYFGRQNSAAPAYGLGFLRAFLRGEDVVKEQFPFRNTGVIKDTVDRAFADRHMPEVPALALETREPEIVMSQGQPSRRNQFGYRGADFSLARKPGTTRIATLGGSFVFGAGVRDEETWAHLLENGLNSSGKGSYEVVNLGISGSNIHDVLLTLMKFARVMPLDYAVVVSAYNNHYLLSMEHRFNWATKLDFYLYNSSVFWVMVDEKMSRLAAEPVDFRLYRRKVHVDLEELDRWVQTYRQRLEQVDTICKENGIRLVLVAQPYVFPDRRIAALDTVSERDVEEMARKIRSERDVWQTELAFYLQGRQNIEMKRVAAERGASFFNAVELYPEVKQPFFWDQIHPNVEGSRMLAAGLTRFFETLPASAAQP